MNKKTIVVSILLGITLGFLTTNVSGFNNDPDCTPYSTTCKDYLSPHCECAAIKRCNLGMFMNMTVLATECCPDTSGQGVYCCERTKHVFSCKQNGMDQTCPSDQDWVKCRKYANHTCMSGLCTDLP